MNKKIAIIIQLHEICTVAMIISIYGRGNWGSELWNNLPKFTHLFSSELSLGPQSRKRKGGKEKKYMTKDSSLSVVLRNTYAKCPESL